MIRRDANRIPTPEMHRRLPGTGIELEPFSRRLRREAKSGKSYDRGATSGRTMSYDYDSLYRLKSETVNSDPNNKNGMISYEYDKVGNRTTLDSTLPPAGLMNYSYDADDRLSSEQYDANGNTTFSNAVGNSYDYDNQLTNRGAALIGYDGDGNRVSETVGGVTTNYLVDTQNPTGYAQVVDELQNGSVVRSYSYGLERISETQPINSTLTTSFYGYDGHGSVRFLTNSAGAVTDTYDYDAFGNLINSTGTTPNNYLFAGEQYDPNLGLYYNRARYLNTMTGRFLTMDSDEGNSESPKSLHKYTYVQNDPIDELDPTGRFIVSNFIYGQIVHTKIGIDFERKIPGGISDASVSSILGLTVPGGAIRPDLTDTFLHQVYEIKPAGSEALGIVQLAGYLVLLNKFDAGHNIWTPGFAYIPPAVIQINSFAFAIATPPITGVITYQVLDIREVVSVVVTAATYQLSTAVGAATLTSAYAGGVI